MQINIKRLNDQCTLPSYQTEFSAGADLYANVSASIEPGATVLIGTGIALEIPNGYAGFIFARSGLATKQGLAPANKVGVIDSDYRGEIKVSLFNQSSQTQSVAVGDRIAQLVIMPIVQVEFNVVDTISDTKRGVGGFGSTGTK